MRWQGVIVAVGVAVAVATAQAEPGAGQARPAGRLTVPIVDEHGAPVFCTRNDATGLARPDGDGGYRLDGLRAGRWVVTIDLPHERVDVLAEVPAGGDVVVPPVVARGLCQRVSLARRPDLDQLVESPSAWAVRFGRTYRHSPGGIAEVGNGFRWGGSSRRSPMRMPDRTPDLVH